MHESPRHIFAVLPCCLAAAVLASCASSGPKVCRLDADCGSGEVCNDGVCFFSHRPPSVGSAGNGTSGGQPGSSTSTSPGGSGATGGASAAQPEGTSGAGSSGGGSQGQGSTTGQPTGWTGGGSGSQTSGGGCSCSASCCSQIAGAGLTCPDGQYCYGVADGGSPFYCADTGTVSGKDVGKCLPFDPCNGGSGVWTCGGGASAGQTGGGSSSGTVSVDPAGVSFTFMGDTRPATDCACSDTASCVSCGYPDLLTYCARSL